MKLEEEQSELDLEVATEEDGVRERAGLEGGAGGGLAEGAGGHCLPLRTLLPQQRCHRTGSRTHYIRSSCQLPLSLSLSFAEFGQMDKGLILPL